MVRAMANFINIDAISLIECEIYISEDGKKTWVNVDGVCKLRVMMKGGRILIRDCTRK